MASIAIRATTNPPEVPRPSCLDCVCLCGRVAAGSAPEMPSAVNLFLA